MEEVWKDVVGYESLYQVSNLGRVKHLPRRLRFVSKKGTESWRVTAERICSWNVTREGYVLAHLSADKVRRAPTVHELVMAAFVGPRPEGLHINHINGVKQDNRLQNLEYLTCSENHKHAVRLGLNTQARPVVGVAAGSQVAFPSASEAERALGLKRGLVQYAAKVGRAAAGYTWSRA